MALFLFCLLLIIWILVLQNKISALKIDINELERLVANLNKKITVLCNENKQNTENIVNNIEQQEQPQKEEQIIDNQSEFIVKENNINEKEEIEKDVTEKAEQEEKSVYSHYSNIHTVQNEDKSIEKMFLGNIYAIVGAIGLIAACCFFATKIAEYLSPLMKTIIGLLIGVGIIITGLKINKKENLKQYSEVVTGTGFAILFIIVYCATLLAHVFSMPVCTLIGFIILIAAYFIADKQKTVSMLAIALIGGYLNVLIASNEASFIVFFCYLIFLNLISIIFVLRNPEKNHINIINIIVTTVLTLGYMISNYKEMTAFNIIYPAILSIMYLLYDVKLRTDNDKYDEIGCLNWFNYGCVTLLSIFILHDKYYAGLFQLFTAVLAGFAACWFMAKNLYKFKIYLRIMLLSLYLIITFTTEGTLRIGLWSLGAIILCYVSSTYNKEYLAKWSLGFVCSAIAGIFILNKDMIYLFNASSYCPVFNTRTLSFMAPVLACFVCSTIFDKMKDEYCKTFASFMKFCAISLIYVLITFEISDYIQYTFGGKTNITFIFGMIYSIIGSIYCLQMRYMSKLALRNLYISASAVAGVIALTLLFTIGLTYNPIDSFIPIVNIRFIAYIFAIASSIYLAKETNKDAFKYLAVFLGFMLISVEGIDYVKSINNDNLNYMLSILWIIYAGILTGIGIFKDIKYLKVSGIIITSLAIIKIIAIDMANVETIYRILISSFIGIILLGISYYYNSKQK